MDLNGIQAFVLHPQVELFVNFLDAVLLEAIAHAVSSVRAGHIATFNADYFGGAECSSNASRFQEVANLSGDGRAVQLAGDFIGPQTP